VPNAAWAAGAAQATFSKTRASERLTLSYRLYYHRSMAQREKRSISLPPDLARAVDDAARAEGTTFSAWLAQTAAHRLKLEAGRQAIAEWELENGPLTPEELAEGRARARALLGRDASGA
jgi:predicted transcriptional regulator